MPCPPDVLWVPWTTHWNHLGSFNSDWHLCPNSENLMFLVLGAGWVWKFSKLSPFSLLRCQQVTLPSLPFLIVSTLLGYFPGYAQCLKLCYLKIRMKISPWSNISCNHVLSSCTFQTNQTSSISCPQWLSLLPPQPFTLKSAPDWVLLQSWSCCCSQTVTSLGLQDPMLSLPFLSRSSFLPDLSMLRVPQTWCSAIFTSHSTSHAFQYLGPWLF